MKSLIHLNVHNEFISLVYTGSFKLPGANSLGVHNITSGVVCSITKVKQFLAKLLKDYLNCQKLTYIYDTTISPLLFFDPTDWHVDRWKQSDLLISDSTQQQKKYLFCMKYVWHFYGKGNRWSMFILQIVDLSCELFCMQVFLLDKVVP